MILILNIPLSWIVYGRNVLGYHFALICIFFKDQRHCWLELQLLLSCEYSVKLVNDQVELIVL